MSWLFSALAIADRIAFSTTLLALLGVYLKIAKASLTGFPRTRSATMPTLLGDILIYLTWQRASIGSHLPPYFRAVERTVCAPWPLNVRVGANSPNLCPTASSVIYTGT